MRQYKYKGLFRSSEGDEFSLIIYSNGFINAFFLLTADAIRMGNHYQLHSITNEENGDLRYIDDIMKVGKLIN